MLIASLPPLISAGHVAPSTSADAGQWVHGEDLPFGVEGAFGAWIGGEFYLSHGHTQPNTDLNVTMKFNVTTNTWTFLGNASSARAEGIGAAYDGVLYAIAGRSPTCATVCDTVEAYDTATSTWTTLSPIPTARAGAGAVTLDGGAILVFGGRDGGRPTTGNASGAVEAYDIAADTWTTMASMPEARSEVQATVYLPATNTVYIFGGFNSTTGLALNGVLALDLSTFSWSTLAPMPTARYSSAAGVCGSSIVVAGGITGGRESRLRTNVTEVYDVFTDTWSTAAPMPYTGSEFAAGDVDNGDFIMAAGSGIHGAALNQTMLYDCFNHLNPDDYPDPSPAIDDGGASSPPPPEPCPDGEMRDESGTCVVGDSSPSEPCPDGEVRDEFGTCVAGGPLPPQPCPEGQVRDESGTCVNAGPGPGPEPCPDGQVRDEFGTCVNAGPGPGPEPCPDGQVRDEFGTCVNAGPGPGPEPGAGDGPRGLVAAFPACDAGASSASGVVRVELEAFNDTDVRVAAIRLGPDGDEPECVGGVFNVTGTYEEFIGDGSAFLADGLGDGEWSFLAWVDLNLNGDLEFFEEPLSKDVGATLPPNAEGLELVITPDAGLPGGRCDVDNGGTVRGRVLDKHSEPVTRDVFVGIRNLADGDDAFTGVDDAGEFTCTLAPGTYQVEARSPDAGFAFQEVTLTALASENVTLTLGFDARPPYRRPTTVYGGTVWGNVTVGGDAARDARISVFPALADGAGDGAARCEPGDPGRRKLSSCGGEGVTNATGNFIVTGLADGVYNLFVEGSRATPRGPDRFFERAITVSGANNTTALHFNMDGLAFDSPAFISGKVTNGAGDPVRGAEVNAWPACERDMPCAPGGFAETNATGDYSIALTPGSYGMYVQAGRDYSGPTLSPTRIDCFPGSESCVIVDGSVVRDFKLAAGATILGDVTDSDGNPVRVFVNAHACDGGGPDGPGECKSAWGESARDAPGTFNIALEPGRYDVRVEADRGMHPDLGAANFRGVNVSEGGMVALCDFDDSGACTAGVIVLGEGTSFEGYVLDDAGAGIRDVNVFANTHVEEPREGPGGPGGWGRTDDDGHYRLTGLVAGVYDVFMEPRESDGFMRVEIRSVSASASTTTWLNHTMSSGGTLAGYVLTQGGRPIAGADVDAFWQPAEMREGPGAKEDFPATGGWGHARTGTNGYYEIRGLADGTFGMFVNPPQGTSYTNAHIDPFRDVLPRVTRDTVTIRNFTLSSGGAITGCVEANGAPVRDAWVSAHSRDTGFGGGEPTRDSGCFTIRGVAPGSYDVEVQPPYRSEYGRAITNGIVVRAGETTDVGTLALSAGVRLAGRVLDAMNAPIEGAHVSAWQHNEGGPDAGPGAFGFAVTDSNGVYNISGLVAGKYGMHVEPAGSSGLSSKFVPDVRVGDSGRYGHDIVLGGGGWLSGRVVDAGGAPISGAWIGAFSHTSGSGSGGVTGADGRFNVSGLEPADDYNLDVFPPPRRGDLAGLHEFPLTVANGEGNDRGDVALVTGGSLHGRVVDADGAGVAYAFINVNGEGTFGWGMTDSDGNFSVKGIRANSGDSLDINVEPPFGSANVPSHATHTWSPDGDSVSDAGTIALTQGGRLTGRITLDGVGVADVEVQVWPALPYSGPPVGGRGTTNAQGWYNVTGLPAAQGWDVRLAPSDGTPGSFTANAVTTSGGVTYYNKTVARGATLSIRITESSSGSPIASALVECRSGDAMKSRPTGTLGYANFTGAPVGVFTCKAHAPGYAPDYVSVTISEIDVGSSVQAALSLASVTPVTVAGDFAPTAGPPGGYLVVVVPADGDIDDRDVTGFNRTSATGAFVIPGMVPGEYVVKILNAAGTTVGSRAVTLSGERVEIGTIAQGEGVGSA